MAGWSVGPIMEKIINACSDYLEEQVGWQTDMKKELESLRENHPKIQAVVFAANQAQIINDQNPALNRWIWQLRDAIDEANDVLNELEYMKLKEQKGKVTSFLFGIDRKILKIGERDLKIDPNLKRLEEAVHKLDKVSGDVTTFLPLLYSAKQGQTEQQVDFYKTGSLPTNDLIGRGKAKEFVMQWLTKPSNEPRSTRYRNISLLSIVGHGGMGKTTLLQHVYEDEEITKEFDLKIWVCVSNNFDVKRIIADMLESLKNERPNLDSVDALQGKLKNEVMSKKFLLVLDDVWEEESRGISKWADVLAPLASGGFGSKIMVTTRTNSIALMFAKLIKKKKEIFKLEGLEEDECLQLLNSHAFAGVENSPDGHKKLRAIAGEIVKKLLGCPLAAEVTGHDLNDNLDEKHWRTVLESNLFRQNFINSILRRSYIVLPTHLQNCFAFCCMFSRDHKFDKDDLVRMWIALGFIQPSRGMTMEDTGGSYFDALVEANFFYKFEDVGRYYKRHDLIYELAQSVSIHECLRVEDDTELSSIIPQTLQHLSVKTINSNILRKIENLKNLRSLFLFSEASNKDLCNAITEIFKASRGLRLVYIYAPSLKMIPEKIENLIHLRYLKIEAANLTKLPRSLTNFFYLQYIICPLTPRQSEGNDILPGDINNLSNLRYVNLLENENSISSICGIGKLRFLQELNMFALRDESGYRIGELEKMNDLCKLRINCLENVKDAGEACSAKLSDKRMLTDLTLCWSNTDSRNTDLDESVLDNLQPPNHLRNLSIEMYMGARSAIWMNDVNLISNLEKIELKFCSEWRTLPPFGQLPYLKSLTLSNMPKVKHLESKLDGNDRYHPYPLLEKLYISKLDALEDWFEAGVAVEDDGCFFPCLIDLHISDVPMLRELPNLPPSLKSLSISRCHPELQFLPSSLESLSSLQFLEIDGVPMLRELPNLPPSLKNLSISRCHPELQFLPSSLESLSSLQFLEIDGVPMLRELPNLPPSLQRLTIRGCHPELKERYGEDGGSDRHKIAHIPDIRIST